MAITWPTMTDSSGLSTNGTPITKALFDLIKDGINGLIGEVVDANISFNPGVYTASGGMTWTLTLADQVTLSYAIHNKKMTVWFTLATTTVGGAVSTDLRIEIPAGKIASKTCWTGMGVTINNGTGEAPGRVGVTAGGAYVTLQRFDGSNWTASTNATYTYGEITFPIS